MGPEDRFGQQKGKIMENERNAVRFLRAKVEAGELDSGYLADGMHALMDVVEHEDDKTASMLLEYPFAWLIGFFGYATEFMAYQDERKG
jgi:hypothetical protein